MPANPVCPILHGYIFQDWIEEEQVARAESLQGVQLCPSRGACGASRGSRKDRANSPN